MEDAVNRQKEKLDHMILQNPTVDHFLTQLETKTKVKKIYLAYGILAVVVSWLMFGYGAQLLCNAIGFIYPAYMSIKALETKEKDDDTQWLMYWVTFSLFSVVEFFSDIVCSWIPFYWLAKCLFLVWCMSPMNGSEKIYKTLVLPWFRKNQSDVDKIISAGREKISLVTGGVLQEAANVAANQGKKDE